MAKTLQLKRYDFNTVTSTTGAAGELIIDTDSNVITVHDGSTAGGTRVAKEVTVDAASTLAQAAFNAANTASSGGGSTGDYTFSANTITLPDFTDGELNVSGNVATNTTISWAYDSLFTDKWHSDANNSQSLATTYFNAGSDMTSPAYRLQIGNNLENVEIDNFAIYMSGLPIGTQLTLTGTFGESRVTTLTSQFTYNGVAWNANATLDSGSNQNFTVKSFTFTESTDVQTNFKYQFTQTGEFISDSALLGDVLVSNDIITPLSYNSYGVASSGILTVNGDLDVTGSITGTGLAPTSYITFTPAMDHDAAIANGTILEANKKYLIKASGHVILPQATASIVGSEVEVFFQYNTGFLTIWDYDTESNKNYIVKPTYISLPGSETVGSENGYSNIQLGSLVKVKFVLTSWAGIGTQYKWYIVW